MKEIIEEFCPKEFLSLRPLVKTAHKSSPASPCHPSHSETPREGSLLLPEGSFAGPSQLPQCWWLFPRNIPGGFHRAGLGEAGKSRCETPPPSPLTPWFVSNPLPVFSGNLLPDGASPSVQIPKIRLRIFSHFKPICAACVAGIVLLEQGGQLQGLPEGGKAQGGLSGSWVNWDNTWGLQEGWNSPPGRVCSPRWESTSQDPAWGFGSGSCWFPTHSTCSKACWRQLEPPC